MRRRVLRCWARGYTTEVAHDGQHALSSALRFHPNVVFLDIGMPVMNGYEVARALREIPGLRQVFCIALTGWGTESDRMRAQEAGIDRHLTKPVDIADVESVLSEVPRARLNPIGGLRVVGPLKRLDHSPEPWVDPP